jgi:hypothetical protein
MQSPWALNPKRVERRLRTKGASKAKKDLAQADAAKLFVMAYFGKFVANGLAEWHRLDDGTVRLQLRTGETFLLEKMTITRIA